MFGIGGRTETGQPWTFTTYLLTGLGQQPGTIEQIFFKAQSPAKHFKLLRLLNGWACTDLKKNLCKGF